jgi:hypothetical protein
VVVLHGNVEAAPHGRGERQAPQSGLLSGVDHTIDSVFQDQGRHRPWLGQHEPGRRRRRHGNRPYANLFEGNVVGLAWFDGSHGPSAGPGNTLFRNAIIGHGLLFTPTSPPTSGQNLVGNDVSMAAVFGPDHFQHGNRVARGEAYALHPPGSGLLPDVSYYLAPGPLEPVAPPWWTLSDRVPTIGPGATVAWGDSRNPARARWDAGGTLTVGTGDPLQLTGEGPHASPAPAAPFVYLPSVLVLGPDPLTVPGAGVPPPRVTAGEP